MRIQLLFALVLLLASTNLSTARAEEPLTIQSDRVVGTIYGKEITAADIGLTKPIDIKHKFDARDKDYWQLRQRITQQFGKPINDRFTKEHISAVTQKEIDKFRKKSLQQRKKNLQEQEARLKELTTRLDEPNLPVNERKKLQKSLDTLQRVLPSQRDSVNRAIPNEMAKMFLSAYKAELKLHRTYGGRVIFQQFGPEALDARRKLYEAAEQNGDLKFNDPGVRHLFYYYYTNMKHTAVDEDVLEKVLSFDSPPVPPNTKPQPNNRRTELPPQPLKHTIARLEQNIKQLSRRVTALERQRDATKPKPTPPKPTPRKTPQAQKEWLITESKPESIEFAPKQIVPVDSGIWFGGQLPGRGNAPLGYFDLESAQITLLLENASLKWGAVGQEALAIQLDRKSLVKLNAANQSVTTWEKRPTDCRYFSQVVAYKDRFCISSPYNPLWIFDPWLQTWQKIELQRVTDSDSERLGPSYYRPSMQKFVIGPSGHFWGFQGTHDALRGNAVVHYAPANGNWQHHGFPWAMARGDDYIPIGETDTVVWFKGRRDLLFLDKSSHSWITTEVNLPKGSTGSPNFTHLGVLIPTGHTLKRFSPETSSWEDLASLDSDGRITAVATSEDTLYLATNNGLHQLERMGGTNSLKQAFSLGECPTKLNPTKRSSDLPQKNLPSSLPTNSARQQPLATSSASKRYWPTVPISKPQPTPPAIHPCY